MGTHLRAAGHHLPYGITVLPATRHKWTRPALTGTARQPGNRFTYPGGMEGWVDLGSMIAARPGIEPRTAWSQVTNALTVTPLSHPNISLKASAVVSYVECWLHVATVVVVLAMLGMLSPASRGALMTAGIFIFMFMGFVAMTRLRIYHAFTSNVIC